MRCSPCRGETGSGWFLFAVLMSEMTLVYPAVKVHVSPRWNVHPDTDIPAEVLWCPSLQNHWESLQSIDFLPASLLCSLGQSARTGAVDASKTRVKCSCLTFDSIVGDVAVIL